MVAMGKRSDAARMLHILHGMRQRCFKATHVYYRYYGGRGITICQEWLDSPARFVAWGINNGYADGLQIDRINNDGNYEPGNCRWVTASVNQNNRRMPPKSSKFKGVWKQSVLTRRGKKWRAGIRIGGKTIGLGTFATEQEAAMAYDEYAVLQYGERAICNFPRQRQGVGS